jgi:hypothetical protein
MAWELKDYREVPERIAEWFERHPEGRIVCEIVEFTPDRVTVKASVFRGADSLEPPAGVGHSYLGVPGTTPYTKGSELENAETSAAGRALVMAGIPAKSVASEGEVRTKSQTVEPGSTVTSPEATGVAARDGESVAYGEGAADSSTSPEEEQAEAYRQVLRGGPGNTQAVLMARKLFETDARKVKNLRVLSVDELFEVVQAFKEKVSS